MAKERIETLIQAADRTLSLVTNPNYPKLLESTLSLVIDDVAAELGDNEAVQLVVTCDVAHDGREHPGILVISERRVIVAWTVGLLHPQTHQSSLARNERLVATTLLRKAGVLKGWRTDVTLRVGDTFVEVSAQDEKTGVIGTQIDGLLKQAGA